MTLRYLLDTNICIFIRQAKPQSVLDRLKTVQPGEIGMSTITFGELVHGAEKSQQRDTALEKLGRLRDRVPVLDIDGAVGQHYGEIRAHLEQRGEVIGNNDLWIAAHARARRLRLVTNNTREFDRVPGLQVEDWTLAPQAGGGAAP